MNNKIIYNSEIKQTKGNGVFDIVFDSNELKMDWGISFQEFIECNLYSNKRLIPIIANKQPQALRGGSPCDFVFNTEGVLFGSYIDFASKIKGDLNQKNTAILEAFTEKLKDMEKNNLINESKVNTTYIDNINGKITYNLYVKSGENSINKQFVIYANN